MKLVCSVTVGLGCFPCFLFFSVVEKVTYQSEKAFLSNDFQTNGWHRGILRPCLINAALLPAVIIYNEGQ